MEQITQHGLGQGAEHYLHRHPGDIRDKYRYYTQAEPGKLRAAGYDAPLTSLEEGVGDYVENYLSPQRYM